MTDRGTAAPEDRTSQKPRSATDLEMSFRSILFGSQDAPATVEETPEPSCFGDLNVDQIVNVLVSGRSVHKLEGYFRVTLTDLDVVAYRHEVFRDLQREGVLAAVTDFTVTMDRVRTLLKRVTKRYHHYEAARWFLDATCLYAEAVTRLITDLDNSNPESRGLRGLLSYAIAYTMSDRYVPMRDEAARIHGCLDALRYDLWLHGAQVTVGSYDDERNYSTVVARTFARFQQRPTDPTTETDSSGRDLDPVEGRILEQVAKLFPEPFADLDEFTRVHAEFRDPVITAFDREVHFYLSYLDLIRPLRAAGLAFELPTLSSENKTENATDTFDIALACRFVPDGKPVVTNDYRLSGEERILVITGPNNGGKTTMARTVGQMHHLAALGCPVPGRDVRLFLCDVVYTHFERREDPSALAGKLQEELQRFADDFARATSSSLIVMNEMFSSTTVRDALFLSRAMLGRIRDVDALGLCVTFLDELATYDDSTVSMVSEVEPDDPATRTYKVVRRPADGRAYARAIADKYGLTRARLSQRVQS